MLKVKLSHQLLSQQEAVSVLLKNTVLCLPRCCCCYCCCCYVTYLGLKAVTGVFLASSLYCVVILLAAILDFGSSKTSAILETGRLQVSDVLGITKSAFLAWVLYQFHVLSVFYYSYFPMLFLSQIGSCYWSVFPGWY